MLWKVIGFCLPSKVDRFTTLATLEWDTFLFFAILFRFLIFIASSSTACLRDREIEQFLYTELSRLVVIP